MSIFSNIWSKASQQWKNVGEQWSAASQIGAPGMFNIAKSRLSAGLFPSTKAPVTQNAGQSIISEQGTPINFVTNPQPTPEYVKSVLAPNVTQASAQTTSDYLQPFYNPTVGTSYYQPSVTTGGATGGQPSGGQTSIQGTTGTRVGSSGKIKYVPPPQAPSGQAGTSYAPTQPSPTQPISSAGYSYTPYQAPSGVSGTSSHTGLLGGVSSGLGLPSQTTTDEEKDSMIQPQQGGYINPQTQQSFPMGTASQGYTAQGQPIAPAPQVQGGQLQPGGQIQQGYPQQQPQQPTGLSLPSILTKEGAIDLTASQAGIDRVKDLLKSPQTKQTQSQMLEYLENSKNTLLQALQEAQPLPDEPIPTPEFIAETQEELDQIQSYEHQQYDDWARELGFPQTITDLENAYKELQATDQAFNAIMEDVNSDPDFPKGLARTRIAAIQKEKGVRMNALQNKIGLLQTSLEMKKEELADRMGITQRAISRQAEQQEEAKQDAQRQVQMLISSEGIETMSDAELSQLAQAAGYTLSSLRKIREAVKSQSQAKITKAQNDLIKQQETMELARQREARLAGGDETTDDPTTVDDDKITVNPDGSITVGGVEIPASGETTDKAGFNLFNPSTWLNFLK